MKKRHNSILLTLLTCITACLVALIVLGILSEAQILKYPQESNINTSFEETVNQDASTQDKSSSAETPENSVDKQETSSEDAFVESSEEVTSQLESPENSTENIVNEPISNGGTIYLTFDDGPSTQITSQILDILKSKNIQATFFIVDYDYNSEKEELVKREINEGHTVGLHGTSHDYSAIYTSLENLENNFITLQEKVFNSTGYKPTIVRFPGGSSNTVSKKYCKGIMSQAVQTISELGFTYFDWNIESGDAGSVKSASEVFENVTSSLREGHVNLVLMHDSYNKTYTLEALESIIDYGLEHGYEFKPITSETPQITHHVAN